jgi:hypothetical protein
MNESRTDHQYLIHWATRFRAHRGAGAHDSERLLHSQERITHYRPPHPILPASPSSTGAKSLSTATASISTTR